MSYLRQREFGLARHLAFWPLCHSACHSLVARAFGRYMYRSYWAISMYYNNWACHSLAIWPDIWTFGLYVIWPVIALLYNICDCHRLATRVFRNYPIASTGLYLYITIIWYIVPVLTVTSWHVLGHISVSRAYLSTRFPLTP